MIDLRGASAVVCCWDLRGAQFASAFLTDRDALRHFSQVALNSGAARRRTSRGRSLPSWKSASSDLP
jgi:hypothetical protein